MECLPPLLLSPFSFRRRILLSQHNKGKINARRIKCRTREVQSFFGGITIILQASAYCKHVLFCWDYRANKKKWLLGGGGKQAKLEVPEVKRGQESYGAEAGPGILFYLSLRTACPDSPPHRQRSRYGFGCQPKEALRLIEMLRPSSLIFRASLAMTSSKKF